MRARASGGKRMLSYPKIVDDPRVGSSNPRIMRMVVVLPAPLRPMKAKTLPRGKLDETATTAHWLPKSFVKPRVWMTASGESARGEASSDSEQVMVFLQQVSFRFPGQIVSHLQLGGSRRP